MKVGIVMDDERGIEGNVSAHFGQCKYFFFADIDGESKTVTSTQIVPNLLSHGGGGCVAVDEIVKYNITHVVTAGMGMGAQAKFERAGVKVLGYSGKVKDALDSFINKSLGDVEPCKDHGGDCHH